MKEPAEEWMKHVDKIVEHPPEDEFQLVVICEQCRQPTAIVHLDRLKRPVTGAMFSSHDPAHFPDPWEAWQTWEEIRCIFGPKSEQYGHRAWTDPNHIFTHKGYIGIPVAPRKRAAAVEQQEGGDANGMREEGQSTEGQVSSTEVTEARHADRQKRPATAARK